MAEELGSMGLAELELDEQGFRSAHGAWVFGLANAYEEWARAARLRRGGVLRRWATAFAAPSDPPATFEEGRPHMLPRVRELEYYSIVALRYVREDDDDQELGATYRPLNEQLAVELVYDQPTMLSSIRPELLDQWGVSFEDVLRTARANLRERTSGTFAELQPGVYGSPWQDAYDSSRLLLTELISRLEVRGDPVALLPHHDHLLLSGSDDEKGLGRIAAIAEPLLADQRAVTGRAFVWREGAWQPFLSPPGHPKRERFLRLVRLTEARDAEDQGQALEARKEAAGRDVFVASLTLASDPTTAPSSPSPPGRKASRACCRARTRSSRPAPRGR